MKFKVNFLFIQKHKLNIKYKSIKDTRIYFQYCEFWFMKLLKL